MYTHGKQRFAFLSGFFCICVVIAVARMCSELYGWSGSENTRFCHT
jgi:hypothetical protein